MITRKKDGHWLAKCEMCTWKTLEQDRERAENSLMNHINITHRVRVNGVKEQELLLSSNEKRSIEHLPKPV